jgi:hypothetical protein
MPQDVTPLLLDTSRPISSIQSLHRMCLTRTFLQSLCGFKEHASGSPDSADLPLGGCTMLSPLLVNASTSGFFLLLSKVQPLMRTSALSKALLLPHSERHALHTAFWRTIRSGSSVWRRQGPWQQVISFAISLSPFFTTMLPQILFSFGTHTSLTSVITCTIAFSRATFMSTPPMLMSRIIAFISSISFLCPPESPLLSIGHTCLRWLRIGMQTLTTITLQSSTAMTARSRQS